METPAETGGYEFTGHDTVYMFLQTILLNINIHLVHLTQHSIYQTQLQMG